MRDRPLCVICLALSVFLSISVYLGGSRFRKELMPSQTELFCKEGDEVLLSGRVYGKTESDSYQLLYLKENSVFYHQHSLKESKIIVYEQSKKTIKLGDVLEVEGEIDFFENAGNPGNFDQKKYYQRQDIHAAVWAGRTSVKAGNKRIWTEILKESLYRFRQAWRTQLYAAMEEKEAGILCAVLLGDKTRLDGEVKELYRVSGIGHILAISGLHLSLLGMGMYRLVRRISGSYVAGGLLGAVFMTLYVLMIGMSISVCRAFLSFLFRVGADMTGRSYDGVTALSFSAAAVLFWRPLSIGDAGFWLSFGAVAALYLVEPAFRELPVQALWASVSIQLATLPVLLAFYYAVPTYSVFLNLLVLPLLPLVFVGAIAGSLLVGIGFPAGGLALKAAAVIFGFYEKICGFVMGVPGAEIVAGKPSGKQIAAYYAALVAALWLYRMLRRGKRGEAGQKKREEKRGEKRGGKKKLHRYLIPAAVYLFGVLVLLLPWGRTGKLTVTMLDIGQGDCIFLRGPTGDTYLVDGGSSDVKEVAKYRIEPFLKSQGVKELDYVFVSHGDADHLNGISEMLEREKAGIRIRTLVLPAESVWDEALQALWESAREKGVETVTARPGQSVQEGALSVTCMLPCGTEEKKGEETGNESSMVLALSYGIFDMLFTGNLEGGGEEKLKTLLEADGRKFEVLKTAHHGSKNSTSEEFLSVLRPEIALISAGKDNRYGHPHEETLERLKKAGCRAYCTQETGAVTITAREEKNCFCLEFYREIQYTFRHEEHK